MLKVKKDSDTEQKLVKVPKKKKSDEKIKSSEDSGRKYGYISPLSINCIAESIGISGLSEAVTQTLSEDVSYRLRHVIQLTRHKKLTTRDVAEVFKMCDVPDNLGSGFFEAPAEFVNVGESSFFIKNDPEVDLHEYALAEMSVPSLPKIFVTGSWTTGDEAEVKDEAENSTDSVPANHLSPVKTEPNANHKMELNTLDENSHISKNLIKYYSITCSTILGHSDLSLIHRDLSTSTKIFGIVPYLLNFLTITLNRLSSERQIVRLLHTVEALVANKKIDLSSQWPAARIGKALLLLVAGLDSSQQVNNKLPVAKSKVSNYSMRMRRYAAITTAKVLSSWCVREEEKWQIIPQIGKILSGAQKSTVKVLYGALHLVIALGPKTINTALQFDEVLANLVTMPKTPDLQLFEDSLLIAMNMVMRYPESWDASVITSDRAIYEYFGETLICRRSQELMVANMCPKNQSNVSVTRISSQSGMKYLSSRYKPTQSRPQITEIFDLPDAMLARKSRISFKFGGVRPEVSLKRRRFPTAGNCGEQFIPGKHSEGHVVLVGKMTPKASSRRGCCLPSLFYIL